MENKIISIIKTAESFLGTPYKYGVKKEEIPNFLDCSSFTQLVFQNSCNINIERSTIAQALKGTRVNEQCPQPGDLIFFRGTKGHFNDEWFPPEQWGFNICIGHVVLYIGNEAAIHASGKPDKRSVVKQPLKQIIKEYGPIVLIKRIL